MVYVSNDNSSYIEVKEWEAATGAGGEMVITFATPVTARFIKVQCQFDDRDHAYQPVNRAEFKHRTEELIKVYYTITSRYEEYAYDAAGNRVQERITLRMTETRNYSYYPNSSRLLTNGVYGFVYDANGNLIRKGTSFTITGNGIELKEEGEYWEYRYDLLNRLTEVKKNGATVARYRYDETDLRVKKESGNGTIYYVFNLEGQVLYEEENQGYVEYIYLLGRHFVRVDGYRTATTEERTTYFYHTDHLGSTILVTDEAGATVWSTEYTPFGSLTFEEGKLKKAVKFTGKDLDEDTGLYYFNARWYDQSIGRFISEDPIKDGLNWYTYAANNPLRFVDPTGLTTENNEDNELNRVLDEIVERYDQMIQTARDKGYNVAANNLQRFLDGTGGTVDIDSQWLKTFSSVLKAQNTNIKRFEKQLELIAHELEDGETRVFTDYWDSQQTASIFTELYYASGTFTITSTGDFILSRYGNKVIIEGKVSHRWWDPYDWHPGLGAFIPGFGAVSDRDALLLQEYRGAKPFMMESIWEQNLNAEIISRKLWFDSKKFNWSDKFGEKIGSHEEVKIWVHLCIFYHLL